MTFRPWTSEEDDTIVRLFSEGKRVGPISEALDRHVKSTSMRMLTLRKKGRLPPSHTGIVERVVLGDPGITLNGDDRLVRSCRDEGGFPQAVSLSGRTFWVKPDGSQWAHTPAVKMRQAA